MRIFHPRPQIGLQKFIGVEFRGGVAEVDELHPERRVALEQHGFTIEDTAPEPAPAPLADLTVAELREIAEFEGVEVPKGAKKTDIVAALEGRAEPTVPALAVGGVSDRSPAWFEPEGEEPAVSAPDDEV